MGKSRLLLTAIFVSLCCCMAWPQQRVITIDELFRLVDNHSKSIRASEAAVKQAGEAVQVAKANRLPSVDASLSFSYLGDGRIWDRDFSNGMKAPIPHFGNNFAIEASQVIYAGGAIQAGIESAGLQQAREQARTREKSVELATRNYDVVNNRYLNDLALVTDMIDAGNSLLAAELMLVNARVNVIYNHYKLQQVSGTL